MLSGILIPPSTHRDVLVVRLTVSAGLTHNSIMTASCVSSLLQSNHPRDIGIAVAETKALLVM